jgi:phospholipid transport system substrate-binding protein
MKRMAIFLISLLFISIQAQVLAASEPPQKVIESSYQSLLNHIKEKTLTSALTHEELYELMERELEPVVDFPRVARKVMGRHARKASDAQLESFTKVFKKTLVLTYSKGLDNIDQLDHLDIGKLNKNDKGNKANVHTEVVLKGNQRYQVVYSMFLNGEKRWMIENIIVEGVNIGLVFRNQFAHYMQEYGRDIDQAIEHWGE